MKLDDLAQEIRRVDGSHSLGAGALAEALLPFILAYEAAKPAAEASGGGSGELVKKLQGLDFALTTMGLEDLGEVALEAASRIEALAALAAPATDAAPTPEEN